MPELQGIKRADVEFYVFLNMIVTVKVKELRIGMFVELPGSWFKHSFLKNRFIIESKEDLNKIIESGLKEISIDTSLGHAVQEIESISHETPPVKPPDEWKPDKDINDELKEAIHDKHLPPEKKAKAVYKNSIDLMSKLLESPTAEAIGEGKEGITHVVDLILKDDDTTSYLMDITSHDFYTYTHSVNVGILSVSLAKKLYKGSNKHDMHELGAGFFLHDLGKTQVDPAIINKPGRLNDAEMFQMRIHPYQSYKILKETKHLTEEAKVIAMQHHERDDGTGYPRRLKGNEIHDYGRICCIADVFDALTAKRSYKKAKKPLEALKIMKEEMIGHFNKEIFKNFIILFT